MMDRVDRLPHGAWPPCALSLTASAPSDFCVSRARESGRSATVSCPPEKTSSSAELRQFGGIVQLPKTQLVII